LDVVLKILALKRNYYLSKQNLVEVIVLILSWLAVIIFFVLDEDFTTNELHTAPTDTPTSTVSSTRKTVNTLLVVYRYAIQFRQLIILVRIQQQMRQSSPVSIDFRKLRNKISGESEQHPEDDRLRDVVDVG